MGSVAAETIADLLARGLSVLFTVEGDSMHPLIRSGDSLLIVPADAERVRRGDVVLAMMERGLTAHRVIRVSSHAGGLEFVMRGDNVYEADPPFGRWELLGRVVAVERSGRKRRVWSASGALLGMLRLAARASGWLARHAGR